VQLDEFICGEGNCVIMIKIATATGHSIGIRLTDSGEIRYFGTYFNRTSSNTG
jgi:hypothetical protein